MQILQRKVELTHDPDERKVAYEKMGELYEIRLERGDDAIEAYRQAMLIDVSDTKVLEALERLYMLRMRWEDLIEILTQQAVILTDDAEVVEKYLQIGDLWESRLQSPDRAIEAFRQALVLDERCMDACDLGRLFTRRSQLRILDIFEMMQGFDGARSGAGYASPGDSQRGPAGCGRHHRYLSTDSRTTARGWGCSRCAGGTLPGGRALG